MQHNPVLFTAPLLCNASACVSRKVNISALPTDIIPGNLFFVFIILVNMSNGDGADLGVIDLSGVCVQYQAGGCWWGTHRAVTTLEMQSPVALLFPRG